jgi:hypothetical protein
MTEGESDAGHNASNKCYCLGPDWFDDSKAPYDVYEIATGKLASQLSTP